jgi:hypothetical protein
VSESPLRVFTEISQPTFADLSNEAFGLARTGMFESPTKWRRLQYYVTGWRLRRVHKWHHAAEWSTLTALWRLGFRRYGILLFWPLALILLLERGFEPFGSVADLLLTLAVLALMATALGGMVMSAWWPMLKHDVRWAEQYRRNRLEWERDMMSPSGYQGWHAVRDSTGGWALERLDKSAT